MPLAQQFRPAYQTPALQQVMVLAEAEKLVAYPAQHQVEMRGGRPGRGQLQLDPDDGPFFVTALRYIDAPEDLDCDVEVRSGNRKMTEGAVPAVLAIEATEQGNNGSVAYGLPRPIVILPGDSLTLELTPRDTAEVYPDDRDILVCGHYLRQPNNQKCGAAGVRVARACLNHGEWYAASVELAAGASGRNLRDQRTLSRPVMFEQLFCDSLLPEVGSFWAGARLDVGTVELWRTSLSSVAQASGEPRRWSMDLRIRCPIKQNLTLRVAEGADFRLRACLTGARFPVPAELAAATI